MGLPTLQNYERKALASPTLFGTRVTELTPNTNYGYRAWAINNVGLTYGSNKTFKTLNYDLPFFRYYDTAGVYDTEANIRFSFYNGGFTEPMSLFYIYYSTTNTRPIDGGLNVQSKGFSGVWEANTDIYVILDGLVRNTDYYYTIQIANGAGQIYSDTKAFTTTDKLPSITTYRAERDAVSDYPNRIECYGWVGLGTNPITTKGFVYNTHDNPRVNDGTSLNVNVGGSSTGSYNLYFEKPASMNLYDIWVRAYAINAFGTAYGVAVKIDELGSY